MTFSRNMSLAAAAFLLWSTAYNLMGPLLPLFARELGASSLQLGLVGAAGTLGAVALVLPISVLSDKLGRRPALLFGWLASAAGLFLMWPARLWTALLPGAFLSMAPVAALPTLNALALDELPPDRRARGFALLYAAAPLGALFGSAVSGLLGSRFGLRTTAAVAGSALLLASLALLPIAEERRQVAGGPPPQEGDQRSKGWIMAFFGVAAAGAFLLMSLPGSFIIPYIKEVSRASLVVAGFSASVLAGSQLGWSVLFSIWPRDSGRLRLGRGRMTLELSRATVQALAVCLVANAFFGLLVPSRWALATLAGLILRGSQFTLQSLGSALLGDVVGSGPNLTTRLTLLSAALGFGAAGAPVVGGWLYGIRPALPFWTTGGAAAVGAGVLWAGLRWLPRTGAGPARPSGTAAATAPATVD